MLEVLGGYKMLSFDENGWLFPDPLKNITHDIDSAEIDDLLKLAKEEDYWSAGIRETVKKRLEKHNSLLRPVTSSILYTLHELPLTTM